MKRELIILGTGPAGMSAAVYAERYNLKSVLIGKGQGLITEAGEVDNFIGVPQVSGMELANRFREHAEHLGVEILHEDVKGLAIEGGDFVVTTDQGEHRSKALIYALGGKKRKLGVPGETKFTGRGVSYCAVCDGMFFKDKTVAVVGGADSACCSALVLTEFAKKIFMIYRRGEVRGAPQYVKQLRERGVEFVLNSVVEKIEGENLVNSITVKNDSGDARNIPVNGVFMEIGYDPNTQFAKAVGVAMNEKKRISVDKDMSTNIAGIFAAGDVTGGSNQFDQVITAAAEGAIAADSAYNYIRSRE